ncbi:PREDICTED: TRMT1-like protein [Propithecus coquereli]|uniref:TRMT1-like protein n=1 Tax=Propithecus coquereli TaxID=379532 RepID=UPI00063FBF12|nr:PREDICTED: TRMT1-like protein [Propithecus coquereli]
MENMAEEELLCLEKEEVEVAQVQVPTPAPDSARVPAPAPDSALDSAPTPASAPAPAPALAQAPALSPSLASAPEEAESKRHFSIQRQLADLEKLAFITEGDFDSANSLNSDNLDAGNKQACPLCPKEKFRACNSHKLRRHLQNLHWKVSVEFEVTKNNKISSKMGAHYHCIICSATITRRTDMLGHVRRHVNKGETKSRYTAGIMGLQWAKHLGNAVKVTINDLNENSVTLIQENCHLNKLKVVMDSKEKEKNDDILEEGEENLGNIKVTKMDANVLMHLRSFDFIHLDPFGTSVNYLDSAFRNIRNLGIVSVTSTDISSLYAKAQHVARRHYGCNIVRTEYYKELAARIVVAAVARSSSLFNTGFLKRMLFESLQHGLDDIQTLIKTLIFESECTPQSQFSIHAPSNLNKQGKRKSNEMITTLAKKQKTDVSTEHPPFYYNIHRHSIKGMNMPKLKKFLCYLSQAGFRVSRTHFDPMGVRTDAPLMQFKSILLKYSTPTYTGGQSEGHVQSAAEDTVTDRVEMSVNDKAEASGCRRW